MGKEDRLSTVIQADEDEDETGQLDKIAEMSVWSVYSDAQSHSNSKLVRLILPALGTSDSSSAWNGLTDLPEAALEWIRGQKHALFPDVPLSSFSEMISALEEFIKRRIPKSILEEGSDSRRE